MFLNLLKKSFSLLFFSLALNLKASEIWNQVILHSKDNQLVHNPEYQLRFNHGGHSTHLYRYHVNINSNILGISHFDHKNQINESRTYFGLIRNFIMLQHRMLIEQRFFEDQKMVNRYRHRSHWAYEKKVYLEIYDEIFYSMNSKGFDEFRLGLAIGKRVKHGLVTAGFSRFYLQNASTRNVVFLQFHALEI